MKDKFKTWAPFLAIALAVVLFAGGTVGNVRAALTYYSDNYDLVIGDICCFSIIIILSLIVNGTLFIFFSNTLLKTLLFILILPTFAFVKVSFKFPFSILGIKFTST